MFFGKTKPKNLDPAGSSEEASGPLVDNDGITPALHGPQCRRIVEVVTQTLVDVELGGDEQLPERL
jgi:hypothetical protein